MSYQEPKLTQQYECDQTTNDRFVAIPNSDRNYMVEIGYTTDEKQWLLLARSSTIRVFSRQGESLWLVADAELLIHGATEPDTKVTVGDYHIKTRPDGTFHLRIPFTDNLIDCIMKAQDSNNGIVKIIHKQFYSDFLDIDGMSH
ncbi:putative phosphate transport system substrate-binding protein [Richelia intracellularis HM01]|nr:putative phosphate transport system substrate-binding protein [Richelia intracellularis HM01]